MTSSTAICSAAGAPYDAMTVVGEAGTYEGLVTRGVVGRGEVGGEDVNTGRGKLACSKLDSES